ncbi:hypothetical protein [Clostridium coskatii]|uniref:Uncharacterized protein n=1 Tax=Clostridium coskatii TaxID=1705578 RepID=A0A162J9G0_9CLOT|nr:hypothetical protein [Clostridium coskatii]OAA92205.1 hypothetical protein WX73_01021 [Clostridium coskatii]OBR97224.1 hypothetical protein CLCOS_05300 [Clostridium coskatii]
MNEKAILEINNKSITYRRMAKKHSIFNLLKKNKIDENVIPVNNIENIRIDLKNKRLFILVHGEEIYVTVMKLPKLKSKLLYKVIRDELKNKFKNLDNIMFSYEIVQSSKYNLEVMVSCMNWHGMDIAKMCSDSGADIKQIVPIQFYMWAKYKNRIKDENYIFILNMNNIIYFMACYRDKIILNNVYKDIFKDGFSEILEQFRFKLNILMPNFNFVTIIFVNFIYKDIIESLSTSYKCRDLGDLR